MKKPADKTQTERRVDDALEEARAKATRGVQTSAFPRPRIGRLGCALLVIVLVWSGVSFAIGLVAAECAHHWGLS